MSRLEIDVSTALASSPFEPLLEIELDMAAFVSDWAYCDRISTYVARMIGHNRADSLLFSNLFSSALNELLESAYRIHAGAGPFVCRVLRRGGLDRVELVIPADDRVRAFYDGVAAELRGDDVREQYRMALFREGAFDPRVSFLELAVDYQARIDAAPAGPDAVLLAAEFALE
jgi:hypothetical protein